MSDGTRTSGRVSSEPVGTDANCRGTVAHFKHSSWAKSCWQVGNSLLPYFGLWYLMYLSVSWSYWITLLLAVPTSGFLVRIFIIQHDCGHHSFFANRRANDVLGQFCGILTITPYLVWRRTHSRHHVTSGNLGHRGHGDVGTLTVREYERRSARDRWRYRVYRNPFYMFFLNASFQFILGQRFTHGMPRSWRRERRNVHMTNLVLVAALGLACCTIGWWPFLLIELPLRVLSAAAGSWLFFIQHQFEEAYWQPDESWDFTRSSLAGSSYYRLPRLLQWFSGNIGFHHIHHFNSRIPNYNLAACYAAEPAFRRAVTFGLRQSMKCASLKLWDEESQRMVSFGAVRVRKAA